jgi:hypothetical protein
MPSFLPFGKSGGLHIRRCQGLAVDDYGGTLGALALKPSDFCNIGDNYSDNNYILMENEAVAHIRACFLT